MKAITIKQPWATLIALGEKKFETRSWQTKYRGQLAIHAGKTIDMEAYEWSEIRTALLKHGIQSHEDLPTGVVLATANLIECHKIKTNYFPMYDEEKASTESGLLIEGDEYWFGDYDEGRYAWELSDLQVLTKSVPAKGKLSLWEWDGGETS